MTYRNSALAHELKRAFRGLARFAPLSTSPAFREWRSYHQLLQHLHQDLSLIEQGRPGLLDELVIESHENELPPAPEISALIARYVGRTARTR